MKTSRKEYLSALLDNEAGEFERRLLYRDLNEDKDLQDLLSRYALVGEALRSPQPVQMARPDFLQGIQSRLDEEPGQVDLAADPVPASGTENIVPMFARSGSKQREHTRMPWLGYGMAAGVAALATATGMLMLQPTMNNTQPAGQMATQQVQMEAVQSAAAPVAVGETQTAAAGDETVENPVIRSLYSASLDPETRKMLKHYVEQHTRYAATNTILPSVRAVSSARDY